MQVRRPRRGWVRFWRIVNPLGRRLAGFLPFWVLLETTGCRTGRRRLTPLAAGPADATGMWLIAAHGHHSDWIRNLRARPAVRVRHNGRWQKGRAVAQPMHEKILAGFNLYARTGVRVSGLDPLLVRVELDG